MNESIINSYTIITVFSFLAVFILVAFFIRKKSSSLKIYLSKYIKKDHIRS